MTDFTLRQLEYFIAVAEEGSVTAAAHRLHISAGAVSQAVTDLEVALGVQLTIRRPAKGVSMTPAGRSAAIQVRNILEKVRDLHDFTRGMRSELHGSLRLGCFSTLSPWVLPPIAAHFTDKSPAITLDFIEGPSDELQEGVLDGTLDAALVLFRHVHPGLEAIEIVPLRLQLLLAANHPLASLEAVPLKRLHDEPAILIDLRPARGLVEELLRGAGFEPKVKWRFKNVETIRSMVARGLGYSAIMGRPVGDRSYDGMPLAYRRIADEIPHNGLTLVYPKHSQPSAKLRFLLDFCRAEFIGQDGQLSTWGPE
ncbi:LysR family transcriptional regulator [Paeniglutamicibacter sp. MACA_103]|uniref:LysR family transcriptional regulator n=1 Tax=Paeniglutamicibacter sp. MACA_103 TaxID=3377337 RepID=UPI0038958EC9